MAAPGYADTLDVQPFTDTTQHVTSPAYSTETSYRLRMYRGPRGTLVALVTELGDNAGPSVTNVAEWIWAQINRRVKPSRFTLVEHYDSNSYPSDRGERFDLVISDGHAIQWKHLGAEGFRGLLA